MLGPNDAPKIYIIARPSIDVNGLSAFLHDHDINCEVSSDIDIEYLVEFAARICYMSYKNNPTTKVDKSLVKSITTSNHSSVIEHLNWSFIISGVSRSFSHQLVRHRVGFSFSQLSQQYTAQNTIDFVIPGQIEQNPEARQVWEDHINNAKATYAKLLSILDPIDISCNKESSRLLRNSARSVLPNATETKLFITANARAIRHFFDLRGSIIGDIEMRVVSAALFTILNNEAPSIFSDFEKLILGDGYPIVVSKLHKQHLQLESVL